MSIKKDLGMDLLKNFLKQSVGFNSGMDDVFIARRRHIEALNKGKESVERSLVQLKIQAGELVAEEIKTSSKQPC